MARLHALVWGLLVFVFNTSESLNVPSEPMPKRSTPGADVPSPRARAKSRMVRLMTRQVNNRLRETFRMVEEVLVHGAEAALLPGARAPGARADPAGKPPEGANNLVEAFLKMHRGSGLDLDEKQTNQVHRMSDFTMGFLDGVVSHRSEKCLYTRFDPAELAKTVNSLSENPLTAIAGLWKILTPLRADTRECQGYAHDVIDTVDAAAKSGTQVMSNLLFNPFSFVYDLRRIDGDIASGVFQQSFDMKKIGHDVGDFIHLGMTGTSKHFQQYVPARIKDKAPAPAAAKAQQKGLFGSVAASIKKVVKHMRR